MKKLYYFFLICLGVITLVACSDEENYLIRVDIQQVVDDEAMEEEEMIVDIITLDSINSLLQEVDWEPNAQPEMSRTEDLVATLFYTEAEDLPEKLYLYRFWFNSDDSVSIFSNNEEEGYGTLNEEYADKLKGLLEV